MHDTTALEERSKFIGALYDNASFFGGRIRVSAFGRIYDNPDVNENWSFRTLPPDGSRSDCSLARHLPAIAKQRGINEILVPSPVDFNAKICWPAELDVIIPVGRQLVLRRGTNADGVRLSIGQTYGLSAAGCAVILAWYPRDPGPGDKIKVAVAHAGFDSLFDRQNALLGLPSRKPESVVDNLLVAMGCHGQKSSRRKRVRAVILFPIPPEEFTYPWKNSEYSNDNKKICNYVRSKWGDSCLPGVAEDGQIDLAEVITQQFIKLGVALDNGGTSNISIVRLSDLFWKIAHPNGGPVWYTTRNVRRHPELREYRNLILVTRTA